MSDCAPEPLPLGCPDPYESELYGGVRREARMCSIADLPILIIDPMNYTSVKSPEILPGRRLARFMEKVTRGMLIHMPSCLLDSDSLIVKVITSLTGNKATGNWFSLPTFSLLQSMRYFLSLFINPNHSC